MILDSVPWKDDLSRRAESLARRARQTRWSQTSYLKIEQDLLLGFYAIRKLIECGKLSDEVRAAPISSIEFNAVRRVHKLNWWEVDQNYELDKPVPRTLDLSFLANQFIHSYVLLSRHADDNSLEGVFVSSDRDRNKCVRFLRVDVLVAVMRDVATDDIVELHYTRDQNKDDFVMVRARRG